MTSSNSFATTGEAEYPLAMCRELADRFAAWFANHDYSPVPAETVLDSPLQIVQKRGRKSPAIISEFGHVLSMPPDTVVDDWGKVLRYIEDGGDSGTEKLLFPVVGIYRTPNEYIAQALDTKHPIDNILAINPELLCAVELNLSKRPAEVISHQVTELRNLAKLIQDNHVEDRDILMSMNPTVAKLMKNKKLKTLENLISRVAEDWPDKHIINNIITGFDLTGIAKPCKLFSYEPTMPSMSITQLRETSKLNNEAMLARVSSSGDSSMDLEMWNKIQEELDMGWLSGPFDSLEQLENFLGTTPHLSRRFPIRQSGKIRLIDDLSESNVNATYGGQDKLSLLDVDAMTSLIRHLEAVLGTEKGAQDLPFDIDQRWKECTSGWCGTTIDLKSAYKQLCVAPHNLWSSCITAFNPHTGRPSMFAQHTLPFGACSSVICFNRVSRLLWMLGCRIMGFLWTNFFDDFPILAPSEVAKATLTASHLFFSLLGWDIATGDKQVSFAESFSALGVTFSVGNIMKTQSFVENSAKRSKDMIDLLRALLLSKRCSAKEAETLRGKLQFMQSQTFGKVAKNLFRQLFYRKMDGFVLDDKLCATVQALISWLSTAKPRPISPKNGMASVLIFSDGACEPSNGKLPLTTCGALIIDPNCHSVSHAREVFGFEVNEKLVTHWTSYGKLQLVTEAELYAFYTAIYTWKNKIANNRCLFFIDSEPAFFSILRGTSDIDPCAEIVHSIHRLMYSVNCFSWFVRIPSKSNPADLPSRLHINEACIEYQAVAIDVIQPEILPVDSPLFTFSERGDEGNQRQSGIEKFQ
jgi:hypothetical protein